MPRRIIGLLSMGWPRSDNQCLRQGLRECGWVEGQNLTFERRYAEGRQEHLWKLARELVQLKVELILAGPLEARAAKSVSSTIPIVVTGMGEPVRTGLVESLARPGGNITGVATLSPELSSKRLELLKAAVPSISRVAVLMNPSVTYLLPELERAAQSLGVTLQPLPIFDAQASPEFDQAFALMTQARADALIVLPGSLIMWQLPRLVTLAAQHRLPAMYPFRYYVDAGGLMAYGPSVVDMAWRVASHVDKILKGAKPADLPVEQAMKFELVFNLEAARALGLTIPPMLLFQADDVIGTPSTMAIPRPPEVNLTPPATDLPSEIAAFSGTWEGLWNGVLPSRLVVESIDADSARVG
jgi:putative ABC transport system substrate-binding protein